MKIKITIRVWSVLFIVWVFACTPSIFASNAKKQLTLFQAMTRARSSVYWINRLDQKRAMLSLKQLKIAEQKIVHSVTIGIAGMKDEVADSRDLESQETQTSQFYGSFQQTFENGIYWKIKQIVRADDALDEDTEDSDFYKTIFSINFPLWGKRTNQTRLANESETIQFQADQEQLEDPLRSAQYEIAMLYLNILKTGIKQRYFDRLAKIYEEQLNWEKGNPGMKKGSSAKQLLMEKFRFHERSIPLVAEMKEETRQLIFLIGEQETDLELVMPEKVEPQFSLEQLSERYIANSNDLQNKKIKLLLLRKDLEWKKTLVSPDFSIGADVGGSTRDELQGNNYRLYLNMSYEFWNGKEEHVHIAATEVGMLENEIERETELLQYQAYTTMRKLERLNRDENTLKKLVDFASQTLQKNRTMFKSRDIPRLTVFENRLTLEEYLYDHQLARLDYWEHLLSIYLKSGQPFAELGENF